MKLVIASDIHGSALCTELLMQRVSEEQPDFIVLLGDLLYHGPRNPLPEGHGPMRVAELLNAHREQIIAVRGNCDAEVDQMVLDFPCMDDFAKLEDEGRTLFFTHGHVHSPENHPVLNAGDFFFSGHTHVKTNDMRDSVTYVNPGSTSLPKDGSKSFAVYENGEVVLKGLENGEVLLDQNQARVPRKNPEALMASTT